MLAQPGQIPILSRQLLSKGVSPSVVIDHQGRSRGKIDGRRELMARVLMDYHVGRSLGLYGTEQSLYNKVLRGLILMCFHIRID